MPRHESYREDITGLRAIAVLAVVLFHIDERLIPGGFAGVDMFFVISGYVITLNIAPQIAAGTFSFSEFYRRRVNRIIPALALVVLVTLLFGQMLLIPAHLQELAKSAIASLTFSANIYFTYFVETGYFAEDSATKPLLHIWSLGVEEQFYIFWPLAAFIVMKLRRPWAIFAVVVALTIALIALSERYIEGDPDFAYYMLPSRAFELLIGVAVALLPVGRTLLKPVAALVWLAGIALLAYSFAYIDPSTPFPGLYALPSTVGTALLIYSGSTTTPLVRILKTLPFQFVGAISYSLYLWHWPVVTYLRYANVSVGLVTGAAAFLTMLALAFLSWRFVEKPVRMRSDMLMTDYIRKFLLPAMTVYLFAAAMLIANGPALRWIAPQYAEALDLLERERLPVRLFGKVCETSNVTMSWATKPACIVNGKTEPRVLLWGDSNASHYFGFLLEIAAEKGFSFRNVAHNGCPPVLTGRGGDFSYPGFRERRDASLETMARVVRKYDAIVISAAWSRHLTNHPELLHHVRRTIESLVRKGKRVILLGEAYRGRRFDAYCPQKELKMWWLDCHESATSGNSSTSILNETIERLAMIARKTGATFVDVSQLICKEGVCSPYLGGHLLFTDSSHLSMAGSRRLGKELLKTGKLPAIFSNLSKTNKLVSARQ